MSNFHELTASSVKIFVNETRRPSRMKRWQFSHFTSNPCLHRFIVTSRSTSSSCLGKTGTSQRDRFIISSRRWSSSSGKDKVLSSFFRTTVFCNAKLGNKEISWSNQTEQEPIKPFDIVANRHNVTGWVVWIPWSVVSFDFLGDLEFDWLSFIVIFFILREMIPIVPLFLIGVLINGLVLFWFVYYMELLFSPISFKIFFNYCVLESGRFSIFHQNHKIRQEGNKIYLQLIVI